MPPPEKPAVCLTEKSVVAGWQQQLGASRHLVTRDGERITIIYPGRGNDDRGPDFCDAVITKGGQLFRGDIEVHTKSSDWRAHRHHLDHRYNKVILHVVHQEDTKYPIRQQNDGIAPTVALSQFINIPEQRHGLPADVSARFPVPCCNVLKSLNGEAIGTILDKAGNARLRTKAAEFQSDLKQIGADQLLYEGIMKALGYRKNTGAFLKLARLMPLSRLERTLRVNMPERDNLASLQALLLGTAGFLPPLSPTRWEMPAVSDDWCRSLGKIWDSLQPLETMGSKEWNLCKVRPSNFPTRRLAGMSYLLLRHHGSGLLTTLIGTLTNSPLQMCHPLLQRALQVSSYGYRARHINAGVPLPTSIPALIGSQRAAEITVNVLLPFSIAWGRSLALPELVRKAFLIYCQHPKSGANAVEKHMKWQLGISSDVVASARRQQGLIHLYRNYCIQGKCDRCRLNVTGRRLFSGFTNEGSKDGSNHT